MGDPTMGFPMMMENLPLVTVIPEIKLIILSTCMVIFHSFWNIPEADSNISTVNQFSPGPSVHLRSSET